MNKRYAVSLALTTLMMGSAHASTLAFYDIESNLTEADGAGATGLTASAIDATSADGTSTNFEWVGSRVPYWLPATINDGTDPGVGDILATFSLTPDAGQQIELGTTDVFDIGVLAYRTSAGYEATARFFVASDSAFSNILATSTTIMDDSSGVDSAPTVGTLGLNTSVTSSSTLYFGVAMVENGTGSNARFDGVGVNGTVSAVPEPSTGLLVAFAASALLLRRRRA